MPCNCVCRSASAIAESSPGNLVPVPGCLEPEACSRVESKRSSSGSRTCNQPSAFHLLHCLLSRMRKLVLICFTRACNALQRPQRYLIKHSTRTKVLPMPAFYATIGRTSTSLMMYALPWVLRLCCCSSGCLTGSPQRQQHFSMRIRPDNTHSMLVAHPGLSQHHVLCHEQACQCIADLPGGLQSSGWVTERMTCARASKLARHLPALTAAPAATPWLWAHPGCLPPELPAARAQGRGSQWQRPAA